MINGIFGLHMENKLKFANNRNTVIAPGPRLKPSLTKDKVDFKGNNLNELLKNAVKAGDLDDIRRVIESGADVNFRDGMGLTMLHLAAMHKKAEVLIELLKNGADLGISDNDGKTALHWACQRMPASVFHAMQPGESQYIAQLKIANELIKAGADVRVIDKNGIQPLHYAVSSDHSDLIVLLVKNGADINAIDSRGKSVFSYAIVRPSAAVTLNRLRTKLLAM